MARSKTKTGTTGPRPSKVRGRRGVSVPGAEMSDGVLDMVASRFRLLGDPSRLRLLNILMHGEHTVQELVEASGLSQTNVSRHLALMRRDSIVGRSRDGNFAVYTIADPTIEELCALVCGGLQQRRSDELDALAR